MPLVQRLRDADISVLVQTQVQALKNQLRKADQEGAHYALIIGDDEATSQSASVKNLRDGSQERLPLAEIPAYLQERLKETA